MFTNFSMDDFKWFELWFLNVHTRQMTLTRISWHDNMESAGILVHLLRYMECTNSLALHQKRFGHYITRLISWLDYKSSMSRVFYILLVLRISLPNILCKYGAIGFGTCSFHFSVQSNLVFEKLFRHWCWYIQLLFDI